MNGNTRYDVTIKCLSSEQSERIKQNILDRIKYNSNFTDTVKVRLSNDGSIMLRVTDLAEAFPTFTYRTTPAAMTNQITDSEGIEILVKCNNDVDAIKVANFMQYQFAGMPAYREGDIIVNIDNSSVLAFIDKKLNIEPDVLFISDVYLI